MHINLLTNLIIKEVWSHEKDKIASILICLDFNVALHLYDEVENENNPLGWNIHTYIRASSLYKTGRIQISSILSLIFSMLWQTCYTGEWNDACSNFEIK